MCFFIIVITSGERTQMFHKVHLWAVCSISEAVGSYAENQRITAVRRVYQRGCVNPMINIEQLWRDYSKYEEVRHNQGLLCLLGPATFQQ